MMHQSAHPLHSLLQASGLLLQSVPVLQAGTAFTGTDIANVAIDADNIAPKSNVRQNDPCVVNLRIVPSPLLTC